MMHDWNGGSGWGWGAWLAMGFMMLAFWGLVAAVIVAVLRSPGHRRDAGAASAPSGDEALRILDERFARGDIDADDYTRRRDLLRSR